MQPSPEPPGDASADADQDASGPAATGASASLTSAVRELERHVAGGGWDGPIRLFALVTTAKALADQPDLADQLPPAAVDAARVDARHLTSVEQEGLPQVSDLEQLLAGIAWPAAVDGAAVVVERIVLPPGVEADLPEDPSLALEHLMRHPARQDVRIAVGVLRDGTAACAVRTRAVDSDDAVATGPDLVPGLVDAVRATLD